MASVDRLGVTWAAIDIALTERNGECSGVQDEERVRDSILQLMMLQGRRRVSCDRLRHDMGFILSAR